MKPAPLKRHICFWLIVAVGLTADLLSKSLVFSELGFPNRQSQWRWTLDGKDVFYFHTTFNQGALWGLGQGWGWLFALVSVGAVCGILYWLFIRGAAASLWLTITLGLVMAGTLGNLYDRLYLHGCVYAPTGEPLYGVRDFLQMNLPLASFTPLNDLQWATYNVADVFLITGAVMLFLQSFSPVAVPEQEPEVTGKQTAITA